MHPETAPLIVLIGPTASGKSRLALDLAGRHSGAILSADAMQVYRGFDRGTAKPTAAERTRVPHFLVDVADPRRDFSAGDFIRHTARALADVRRRGLRPFLVGGTGLYVRAFLRGLFDGPARDQHLRDRLAALSRRRGAEWLHRMLQRVDPVSAGRLPAADHRRVIRALEVRFKSGAPLSRHHAADGELWSDRENNVLKLGLRRTREDLVQRINRRAGGFFRSGLVSEVRRLLEQGVPEQANAFKAIGYREALAVVKGDLSEAEAVQQTAAATRRFAKRQMTWFRREPDVHWIDAGQDPARTLAAADQWLRVGA